MLRRDGVRAMLATPCLPVRPSRRRSSKVGSRTATVRVVTTIPQKELRNQVADVLRRVEAGEEITVTVAGRPSVELRPVSSRRWVGGRALEAVFSGPAPRDLLADLERLDAAIVDPFAL